MSPRLDFLQTLDFVDSRNLPQSHDDIFEVLQVGYVEHYLHAGLAIRRMSRDVSDVAFRVADYARDAL